MFGIHLTEAISRGTSNVGSLGGFCRKAGTPFYVDVRNPYRLITTFGPCVQWRQDAGPRFAVRMPAGA